MRQLFYLLKPVIPRPLQLALRRKLVSFKRERFADIWPIDEKASAQPEKWVGWPNGRKFAFVLSHDVDTILGLKKSKELANLEKKFGFRSSFNFVPRRYSNCFKLRDYLVSNGFEIAVHGLYHDGKLFLREGIFRKRAKAINYYLKKWGSVGFHSPSMHRNLDWIHALNIEYDQSTFDTDPFEPDPEGIGTIFPFWVNANSHGEGYVELPYTLPQDFTLFILMREKGIDIWKRKLDWIAEKGGMALLNTHPDYMNFNGKNFTREEYPARYYAEFLMYVKEKYHGQYWHALPREIARFWRENMVK